MVILGYGLTDLGASRCMGYFFDPPKTIDFVAWLKRVVGWDALLPLVVSALAILIVKIVPFDGVAQLLALVALPVMAFLVRLAVGVHQIETNACGPHFRGLQCLALVFSLFVLAFADFFVAIVAFRGKLVGPTPEELTEFGSVVLPVYAVLVLFAMYPGRRAEEPWI